MTVFGSRCGPGWEPRPAATRPGGPPHWTSLAAAAAAPPPPLPAIDPDDARPPKAAPSLEGAATG